MKTNEESLAVRAENKSKEERQDPFTQEDLERSWTDYTKTIKDAYFSSMFRYCRPVLGANFRIEIDVINPEQERKFKEEQGAIKRYLTGSLRNDLIAFEIRLKENDASELLFTNKEKYSYLLQKNPDLGLLVKEFNLRLD